MYWSQILSGDQIYERFVPIALHHMTVGTALTRAAAAGAAVAFLRWVRKPYQRTELLARLLREFARGRSCSRRLVFLDACHALLKLFSARCTRQSVRHLFQPPQAYQMCDSDRQSQHPASYPDIHRKNSKTFARSSWQEIYIMKNHVLYMHGAMQKSCAGDVIVCKQQ